ncbi:MAG: hypothetical protein LAO76_14525 [Acidobacteriia bacterium]|nr:hypothetical protein [Terriglobia bacterium]
MSFILIAKNGEEIKINAWNWRPALELLRDAEIIDNDLFERMGTYGCKAEVDADTASRIGDYIGTRALAMKPEQGVLADLTVTDRPKKTLIITPDTKIDQIDAIDVYSASYEWLVTFCDFSRTSGGFEML